MSNFSYIYDSISGVIKTVNGDDRIFLYDAFGKLIEERDLSNNLQTSYIYAGSRLLSTETSSGKLPHRRSPRIAEN